MEFVKQFNPKFVIPYLENGKNEVEELASEIGAEVEAEEKLNFKIKDLQIEKPRVF